MFTETQIYPPPANQQWADFLIVVCHSEPGAWDPPLYDTLECPPSERSLPFGTSPPPESTRVYKIGRTMFETDGIPDGWIERLNE